MMQDINITYKTISRASTSIYKDRGSKFFGFAVHVETEVEAKETIAKYREKYHDARHCCYAYRIGIGNNQIYYSSDDCEPHNTAGKPTLAQIVSSGTTNIVVIVIRYFGGILLGTGGLIKAYGTAAHDAIEQSGIIEVEPNIDKHIVIDYSYYHEVINDIKKYNGSIVKQMYNCLENTYDIDIRFPASSCEVFDKY